MLADHVERIDRAAAVACRHDLRIKPDFGDALESDFSAERVGRGLVDFVVAEFYLRVLFPLNDIPMEGSWLLAIPFTFLFVLTVVSWGLWVSGLCRTRLFATQALMFVAMPSFVLSGFTWPAEGMPWFIRFIGNCLPMTYFVNSFRSVYLGGAPLRYVYTDILILLAFLAVNLLVAKLVIQRLLRESTS